MSISNDYLITEKPLRALIRFCAPMIAGNLFQQTYTIVDSAIVGHYNGETALAAVGASYSLTTIFICVAIGGGIGASVIISHHFGARRYGQMRSAVSTAMLTFLGISVLLSAVGLLFSRQIMAALNTPADALEIAVRYLNVYFYGLPFLFMYNILSALFNALEKSRIPLYFLIFSSLLNVALDWYLVAVQGAGVLGAAYATFLAQGLAAVLSFLVFCRELRQYEGASDGLFRQKELWPWPGSHCPPSYSNPRSPLECCWSNRWLTASAPRAFPAFLPPSGMTPSVSFPCPPLAMPFPPTLHRTLELAGLTASPRATGMQTGWSS